MTFDPTNHPLVVSHDSTPKELRDAANRLRPANATNPAIQEAVVVLQFHAGIWTVTDLARLLDVERDELTDERIDDLTEQALITANEEMTR